MSGRGMMSREACRMSCCGNRQSEQRKASLRLARGSSLLAVAMLCTSWRRQRMRWREFMAVCTLMRRRKTSCGFVERFCARQSCCVTENRGIQQSGLTCRGDLSDQRFPMMSGRYFDRVGLVLGRRGLLAVESVCGCRPS